MWVAPVPPNSVLKSFKFSLISPRRPFREMFPLISFLCLIYLAMFIFIYRFWVSADYEKDLKVNGDDLLVFFKK